MALRQVKLEFHDHPVTCPYCRTNLVFTSLMERILAARRTCTVCRKEMLIEDGKAIRIPTEGKIKKPAKRESSR